MVGKFHVSPDGEVRQCTAGIRCRFGDSPHYGSKDEGRVAFSSMMDYGLDGLPEVVVNRFTPIHGYAESSEQFISGLSDVEREAVEYYAREGYMDINGALYSDNVLPNELVSVVERLDSVLGEKSPCQRTLFRKVPIFGSSREEKLADVGRYQVGDEIVLRGFTSTSDSLGSLQPLFHKVPKRGLFTNHLSDSEFSDFDETFQNVIFRFNTDYGVPVGKTTNMTQEREYLMPRNLRVSVVSERSVVFVSDVDANGDAVPSYRTPLTVFDVSIVEH